MIIIQTYNAIKMMMNIKLVKVISVEMTVMRMLEINL